MTNQGCRQEGAAAAKREQRRGGAPLARRPGDRPPPRTVAIGISTLLLLLLSPQTASAKRPSPGKFFFSRNCEISAATKQCCNDINRHWETHHVLWFHQYRYFNNTPRNPKQMAEFAQFSSRQSLLVKSIDGLLGACQKANKSVLPPATRFCWSKERIFSDGINYEIPVATCGPISCSEEILRVVFLTWIDCERDFNASLGGCVYVDRWRCSTSDDLSDSFDVAAAPRMAHFSGILLLVALVGWVAAVL